MNKLNNTIKSRKKETKKMDNYKKEALDRMINKCEDFQSKFVENVNQINLKNANSNLQLYNNKRQSYNVGLPSI